MNNPINYINLLPNDVLKYIFSMLCGEDRAGLCMVSKLWRDIACLATLDLVPNIQLGVSRRNAFRDYHLYVMIKPAMTNEYNIIHACLMGNLEIFRRVFTPQAEPSSLWYAAIGKTSCNELLDELVVIHREYHSKHDNLLYLAASIAGRHNNLDFMYKCVDHMELFGYNVSFTIIYKKSCKGCSVETLAAIEEFANMRGCGINKKLAMHIACKYNNVKVIDYLAPPRIS